MSFQQRRAAKYERVSATGLFEGKMTYQRGFCFLFGLGLACTVFGQQSKPQASIGQARDCFVENKGQWDSRAQFLLQGSSMNMWLTKDGVLLDQYQLVKGDNGKVSQHGDVVKMSFAGANRTFTHGLTSLPGKFNYFIGRDKRKWATDVQRFAEVKTTELYKGISARYYVHGGMPRYDLIVQPGADPSLVAMKFDGAKSVKLASDGTLKIQTSLGVIEEKGLVAYQEVDGKKEIVACKMVKSGDRTCFAAGAYDHRKSLIIDPLFYSSYFYNIMNSDFDLVGLMPAPLGLPQDQRLTFDNEKNVVLAGMVTDQDNFPTSSGAYETTQSKSTVDAVLCKLSADGSKLIFATYFGGTTAVQSTSENILWTAH